MINWPHKNDMTKVAYFLFPYKMFGHVTFSDFSSTRTVFSYICTSYKYQGQLATQLFLEN